MIPHDIELDARAAAAIAAGMMAVALADGEADPRELELIAAFRDAIPDEVDPSGVRLVDDGVRDVFVQSLLMVAMADGRLSDEERAVIQELGRAHGVSSERIDALEQDVRAQFFEPFRELRVFPEARREIARELGIDED